MQEVDRLRTASGQAIPAQPSAATRLPEPRMGRFFDLVNDPVHALSETPRRCPSTAAQTDSTSAPLVKRME